MVVLSVVVVVVVVLVVVVVEVEVVEDVGPATVEVVSPVELLDEDPLLQTLTLLTPPHLVSAVVSPGHASLHSSSSSFHSSIGSSLPQLQFLMVMAA